MPIGRWLIMSKRFVTFDHFLKKWKIMFNKNDIQLGIAPIGWTNDDLPALGGHIPFEQCIREMSEAGFSGSEVGNKYPRDPVELKGHLEPLNLDIASAWFSSYFTEGKRLESTAAFMNHMAFLKAMGAKVVVVCECGYCIQGSDVPVLENKPVFNEKQWKMLTDGLAEIGEAARKNDMRIVYHYHMGTGIQTAAEVDQLMEITDPELVSLLLDTGHITYTGGDSLEILSKHSKRIKHVHLKDIRRNVLDMVRSQKMSFLDSVKAGVFTVPGDGCIEFKPIFQELADSQYKGWFIVEAEQDPDKANPLEYAQKARNYIRNKAGI